MEPRQIPFFSVRHINSIEEYKRFFHTGNYIRQKSAQFPDRRKSGWVLRNMMDCCGYAKLKKFRLHRKEWDTIERKIPLSYLDYLGVKRSVLDCTLELDCQEYERAKTIPLYPRFAVIRLMAGVYGEKALPKNIPESEAVELLRDLSREKKLRCCISYPELKTVFVERSGEVRVAYYPPRIKFTKRWAIPAENGTGIGTSYVK